MTRTLLANGFRNVNLLGCGLTTTMLSSGVQYVYKTLDAIDAKLIESESPRLAALVELANLSTIIGNLFCMGIIKASGGLFEKAGPHKYQDLRATASNSHAQHVEIKVALEDNTPKGHLPKEGHYLTCRYVLGNEQGAFTTGPQRSGDIAWVWELRFGYLEVRHFNVSNTEGDSGKTAVVNPEGMERLAIVYFDRSHCPYGPKSKYIKAIDQPRLPLT